MTSGQDHYRAAEQLLALAATPAAVKATLTDSRILQNLVINGLGGTSVPQLAHAIGLPLSATQYRLESLLDVGLVEQLETGWWITRVPAASTWGPESPTSTGLIVAAAQVHATLADTAATVAVLIDSLHGPSAQSEAAEWAKAVS